MLYPLTFHPLFKERIWGGRQLAELFGKALPPSVPIGESWEISDRAGDVSVIANGEMAGRDLHWLMERHSGELLGPASSQNGRFPLLIKILDAQETLSLQVHPPAEMAGKLRGEPKTEMWYIAEAAPGAELFAGLRRGVTREDFERRIREGSVAECFHRIPVRKGDAMFLPSGRVHAIGAGLVIFEIQQNSDTTYRVFDWNRPGADGKPRALHIAESLASIDFADLEPGLCSVRVTQTGPLEVREVVRDGLFSVEHCTLVAKGATEGTAGTMQVLGVLSGALRVASSKEAVALGPGGFCLLPASLSPVRIESPPGAEFLRIEAGGQPAN